jgi:protein-disulfide isomerase
MKQIIIAVLVVVGIIVGATLIGGKDETTVGAQSNNWYGVEEGIITVTEYTDFQCPACASFFPIVSQVKEQFKDQIRFEIKHFPLVQIHPNATAAHRAAQAAANQGKFWEMHDLLFQQQQAWSQSTNPTAVFEGYATQIGLNMEQYNAEVGTSDILAIINADIEAGKSLNVTGTPTFFIDGKQIEDTASIGSVDGFSAAIQTAIDEKQGTPTTEQDASETPVEAEPEKQPEQ